MKNQKQFDDFRRILSAAISAVEKGQPFQLKPSKQAHEALTLGADVVENERKRRLSSTGRPVGTYASEDKLSKDPVASKKRESMRRMRERRRRELQT